MIQPEIKSILCHDLEYGKEPPDSEDCSVFIEVEIGPKGQEGADIFSFEVATPKFLMGKTETPGAEDIFSWTVFPGPQLKKLSRSSCHTARGRHGMKQQRKLRKTFTGNSRTIERDAQPGRYTGPKAQPVISRAVGRQGHRMRNLKTITLILLTPLVFSSPLFAIERPAGIQKFNITCPASKLLPVIDTAYHDCHNGFVNGSCERFVETFQQLLPKYDCQRPVDATPKKNYTVPAIWIASEGAVEDYTRLLFRLSSPNDKMFSDKWFQKATLDAKKLFGSQKFRDILDGALAEEYVEKSIKVEKRMKAKGK